MSKEIFEDVDSAIFEMLWHWTRKRHNNKPRRWIKDRYFHVHEERNWVFSGVVIERGECWKLCGSSAGHKGPSNGTSKAEEKLILLTPYGKCISRSALA